MNNTFYIIGCRDMYNLRFRPRHVYWWLEIVLHFANTCQQMLLKILCTFYILSLRTMLLL